MFHNDYINDHRIVKEESEEQTNFTKEKPPFVSIFTIESILGLKTHVVKDTLHETAALNCHQESQAESLNNSPTNYFHYSGMNSLHNSSSSDLSLLSTNLLGSMFFSLMHRTCSFLDFF